jgi:phosphoglycerate dehydrogenase-like enzyme
MMQHLLLAVKELEPQNLAVLSEHNIAVVTPDTITEEQIPQVTISYAWDSTIGAKMLAHPDSQLKWVQTMSAGIDYLPAQELENKGVTVTNASGLKAVPIAQTVIGYLLYFMRGLHVYSHRAHWELFKDQYLLKERPVVIFGTGRIGQQIAQYLQAFDVTVYGVNTSGREVAGFDATFAMSDWQKASEEASVVIDVLPGTEATQNFFDQTFFTARQQALYLFINVGRGTTVDQEALLTSLDNGQVRYAALDVAEPEPLPDNHPLFQHENVLLTQHSSWGEHDNPGRSGGLFRLFEQNLPTFLANQPLQHNVVDLTRGY